MFKKIFHSYNNASQWAHHHTAVLVFWLTMLAALFGWNIWSYIQSDTDTYAQGVQADRCDTNSGAISIPHTECLALAQIYVDMDGGNRSLPERAGSVWFSGTDLNTWDGVYAENNHIYILNFSSSNKTNPWVMNFSAFPELTQLNLQYATVGWLDIGSNTMIEYLYLDGISWISTIDVTNNINLRWLYWSFYSNGSTLSVAPDLSNNTNLQQLYLAGHWLSSIDISNNLSLQSLWLSWNNLSSIDVSLHTNLTDLQIQNNNISSLDLSNNPNLNGLTIPNNNILTLDLSNNTNLNTLTALNNGMTDLMLPTTDTLMYMRLQDNSLTSIDLSTLSGLQILYLNNNNLTTFDPGENNINTLYQIDLSNNNIDILWTNFINLSILASKMENNLNGNCLATVDPTLSNFLDENFANWSTTQTCGVQPPICERVTDIPQSECEALVEFYNATDGDNWADNTNWLSSEQVCSYRYGIWCDYNKDIGTPHIDNISLQNNALSWSISSLAELPYLRQIRIDSWIGDPNPNTLFIDLSVFDGLTQLENVSAYNIDTITGSLSSLHASATTIQQIQLSDPKVPFEIDIADLSAFTNIVDVFLSNNIVYGDTSALNALTQVEKFWLSCRGDTQDYCGATWWMAFILSMPNIKEFSIDNLRVWWSIPDISWLIHLEKFNIQQNELTGTLSNLSPLTQLIQFSISDNDISWSLPTFIWSPNLENISLQNNNLIWEIPSHWSNLTQLKEIRIWGKGMNNRWIYGALPASRSNLVNLERIEILFTRINSELPASWSQLNNLTFLTIFFNDIMSEIPAERSAFADGRIMERFWLNNNHLYGVLPSWIENLQNPISIGTNCLDIDEESLSEQMLQVLSANGTSRSKQSNCLSNIQVQKTVVPSVINPGDTFQMIIDYANIGQQKAPNFEISESANEYLTFNWREPIGTQTIVNKTYFDWSDQCFQDLLYGTSGPYYEHMGSALSQFFNGDDGFPTGWSTAEIFDFIWGDFTGGEFSPSDFGSLIDDPMLAIWWALTTVLCAAVEWNMEFDPIFLQEVRENLGTRCMEPFGLDKRLYRDQWCGAWWIDGYRWTIGDLLPWGTGRIVLTLTLDSNVPQGTPITNRSYLDMDGENLWNNDEPSLIIIIWEENNTIDPPYCGDGIINNTEQCDGGNNCNTDCTIKVVRWISNITTTIDYCPDWDFSPNYYDNDCGVGPNISWHNAAGDQKNRDNLIDRYIDFNKEVLRITKSMQCNIRNELVQAYVFAFDLKVTTVNNICNANLQEDVTREEFAKFISTYAIVALNKKPDTARRCIFNDVWSTTVEMQTFAKISCELNIMGLEQNGDPTPIFRPKDLMSRAEVFTAFNRLINGEVDNSESGVRYMKHMNRLLQQKIIFDTSDPKRNTLRWEVLLMLMRAYKKLQE